MALGSGVDSLKMGDLVLTICPSGIQTIFAAPVDQVTKLDGLSLQEAATLPLPFATSIYCLKELANLRQNQIVLIGDASSDVGLAAVQLCRVLGAQVSLAITLLIVAMLISIAILSHQNPEGVRDSSFRDRCPA